MDLQTQHECQMELGQAYVPRQVWDRLFTPGQSLAAGTVFPDLYKPYHPDEMT